MKKSSYIKITILFLLICVIALSAVPYLVHLSGVSRFVAHELADKIGGDVTISRIKWKWFPFPCVEAQEIRISNRILDVRLPSASFYPDWGTIFSSTPRIKKAIFERPEVRLKGLVSRGGGGKGVLPPFNVVVIRAGHLMMTPALISPRIFYGDKEISFAGINAHLVMGQDGIKGYARCVPPFARRFYIKGKVDPSSGTFGLQVRLEGFKPHEILLAALKESPFKPVDSLVNITARMDGRLHGKIHASIKGDSPCWSIRPGGKDMLFACGEANIDITADGSGAMVMIKKLHLTDPKIRLTGSVRYSRGNEGSGNHWAIDLAAKDADLGGIRQKVMDLFGDHHVASLVCGIVRGGHASQFGFKFKGKSADFSRLSSMLITADLQGVPIRVPGIGMNLDDVSGSISISGGILRGSGLSANYKQSHGDDGNLVLGLTHGNRQFLLDIYLNADLADVKPLLTRLVHHNVTFVNELEQITSIQGKAKGWLHVGETLIHPIVRVDISSAMGEAFYKRLNLPVTIESVRRLKVEQDTVSWNGLKGKIGRQLIRSSKGAVKWGNGDVSLMIEGLSARVDTAQLLALLMSYKSLKHALEPVLKGIKGAIIVDNAWLYGPARRPASWKYEISARPVGLHFNSPLLPGPVDVDDGDIKFTQTHVQLSQCRCKVAGTQLSIGAGLSHRFWADWQGSLTISGVLNDALAGWVRAHHWIPDLYFPRTPCRLKGLRVTWGGKRSHIAGTLGFGKVYKDILVSIELNISPGKFSLQGLGVRSGTERADLSLVVHRGRCLRFQMAWNGRVSERTLGAILAENRLLAGEIEGTFGMSYDSCRPMDSSFNGAVEVLDLFWVWGPGDMPLPIKHLKVVGRGQQMDIEKGAFYVGKSFVDLSGKVLFEDDVVRFHLMAKAKRVSWKDLEGLLSNMGMSSLDMAAPGGEISGGHGQGNRTLGIEGTLGFKISTFNVEHRAKMASTPDNTSLPPYTFSDLAGDVQVTKDGKVKVTMSSGMLCGLNVAGTWQSWPAKGKVTVQVDTPTEKTLEFKDLFSCLHVDQDALEGSFSCNATLEGLPGDWQRGSIDLVSRDGTIRRMSFLAKVFSVINVTDLISLDGVPDLFRSGLQYSNATLTGKVESNHLKIEKCEIKGQGLNLYTVGTVDLANWDLDLVVLVAPFKTVDEIVSMVPLLGRALGGKQQMLIAIPVKVKGPAQDPSVTLMPAKAVTGVLKRVFINPLKIPFELLTPDKFKRKQ